MPIHFTTDGHATAHASRARFVQLRPFWSFVRMCAWHSRRMWPRSVYHLANGARSVCQRVALRTNGVCRGSAAVCVVPRARGMATVAVGISGGVDSSVTALLLKQAG